jgi:hypothetical protein
LRVSRSAVLRCSDWTCTWSGVRWMAAETGAEREGVRRAVGVVTFMMVVGGGGVIVREMWIWGIVDVRGESVSDGE